MLLICYIIFRFSKANVTDCSFNTFDNIQAVLITNDEDVFSTQN